MGKHYAFVVVVALCGIAFATQDHHKTAGSVATWTDAIVVEMTSWSPEAEGKDSFVWWSIQKPPGVEQARIEKPYSRWPVIAQRGTAIATDQLKQLRDKLAELAKAKTKPAVVFKSITELTELTADKSCPVRVKVGDKRVLVWSGSKDHDLGPAAVPSNDCGSHWGTGTASGYAPDMKPVCYPYGDQLLVRVRLHYGCEGDHYEDRFIAVAKP